MEDSPVLRCRMDRGNNTFTQINLLQTPGKLGNRLLTETPGPSVFDQKFVAIALKGRKVTTERYIAVFQRNTRSSRLDGTAPQQMGILYGNASQESGAGMGIDGDTGCQRVHEAPSASGKQPVHDRRFRSLKRRFATKFSNRTIPQTVKDEYQTFIGM
jgi:hypothetical protein